LVVILWPGGRMEIRSNVLISGMLLSASALLMVVALMDGSPVIALLSGSLNLLGLGRLRNPLARVSDTAVGLVGGTGGKRMLKIRSRRDVVVRDGKLHVYTGGSLVWTGVGGLIANKADVQAVARWAAQ